MFIQQYTLSYIFIYTGIHLHTLLYTLVHFFDTLSYTFIHFHALACTCRCTLIHARGHFEDLWGIFEDLLRIFVRTWGPFKDICSTFERTLRIFWWSEDLIFIVYVSNLISVQIFRLIRTFLIFRWRHSPTLALPLVATGNLYFRNPRTEFSIRRANFQHDWTIFKFSMTSWPYPRPTLRLCPCRVRALVLMVRMCACVHLAYVRLCLCCVYVLVFMLRTCPCVHVTYVRLCSCCVGVLVFMLRTCACVHVAYVKALPIIVHHYIRIPKY